MSKILVIKPNKEPEVVDVCDIYNAAAEFVGGYVESDSFYPDAITVLSDEDGKRKGKPLNRMVLMDGKPTGDYFVGNMCVAGIKGSEFCGLEDGLIEKYKKLFSLASCGI